MRSWIPQIRGELGLALLLLVAAVVVDYTWVRPQERELDRLASRKRVVERSLMLALTEQAEWDAIMRYMEDKESGEDWQGAYAPQDPLQLLEEMRQEAGLRRFDVRLQEREPQPPFLKTTYFMSVNGSFTKQIRFLKSLEQAEPLITVESFVMDKQDNDPGVTIKLNAAVLTLAAGNVQ